MVKVTISEDCDNAPKKRYIRDFYIAIANADLETAIPMLTDDIILNIPGNEVIKGKANVETELRIDVQHQKISELTVDNIISHGDRCAANGVMKFNNGSTIAFCTIYIFDSYGKNARIKHMMTYSLVVSK